MGAGCLLGINICEGKREDAGLGRGRDQTSASQRPSKASAKLRLWTEYCSSDISCVRPRWTGLYSMTGKVWLCMRQISVAEAGAEGLDSPKLSADLSPCSWVASPSLKRSPGPCLSVASSESLTQDNAYMHDFIRKCNAREAETKGGLSQEGKDSQSQGCYGAVLYLVLSTTEPICDCVLGLSVLGEKGRRASTGGLLLWKEEGAFSVSDVV